jgi:PAS domain S-box-containing protein
MEPLTDEPLVEAEDLSPVAPLNSRTRSLTERLVATLACSPDTESGLRQLRQLLAIASGIVLAFAIVSFFRIRWIPLPLRVFNITLSLAAVYAASFLGFSRRWRWWAIGFCFALTASFTATSILKETDALLGIVVLVLTLMTALIVPWGGRCQAILALTSLSAFAVSDMADGNIDGYDVFRWALLLVTIAFGVSFSALKDYSRRQEILTEESRTREERLRAENSYRIRAEAGLQAEMAQREAAEKLAQKREAILQKVLATSIDTITINAVADNRYIYSNDGFNSTGYSREETANEAQRSLNIWAEPAQYAEFRKTLGETGRINNMEASFRMKAGRIVPCLISSVVVELDGELCIVSMTRDITERKKMEGDLIKAREDALAASRAKSEFLSSMSHEIRTPMNAVLGMADLLTETNLSGEQRRYIDVMVANGNSLLELINSILDLARIESGKLQIEKNEFDLTELIDKTISTFGVTAHSKGLELIARIAPGVPEHLVGDPMRLRQILINFLGNAIKFTQAGQVVLDVDWNTESRRTTELRFSVSDTGIGIAPEKIDSIFTNFTQADSSTTRKYGGTGLGLAIAQRLVSLMNGRIWVDSEVGKGSKFSFTASFELACRVISPTAHVLLNLVGYRVLVVDDNQINRLIAREMIANCGAEVTEVESGEEALIAMRTAAKEGKPFRIVLLDMRMPDMNGLEVARSIRDDHLPMEPLILMLSSDDLQPQLSRLKELGLDAYLVKPITRKELFQAISRVIQDANRNSADALPERKVQVLPAEERREIPLNKILVADDSEDNRLLVGAYLRREACQLDFAEDGRVAVEKFVANHYDMVFMDIQMPEIDGLTATRMIRKWEKENNRSPTPIVALTASALEEDVKSTLAAGCDLHLSKPIKKSVLLDAIRNAALLKAAESPITHAVEESARGQPDSRPLELNGPVESV